jgi:NTE family protein
MNAFVLSGGGSRGALQVLFEAGIRPDMIVGSSVGAVNGAALAAHPDETGLEQLEQFWLGAEMTKIYSPNLITMALRMLLKRDSLVSSGEFHRFVRRHVLPQAKRFADLASVQLYITAVDLGSGQLYIFGDDPADSLVDAIMASTSIQPFFPPWSINDRRFTDGGYLSNLPLLAAIERGADQIFALDLTALGGREECKQGLIPILLHEADIILYHLAQFELGQARRTLSVKLHHIQMTDFDGHPLFDFSQTGEMIKRGREIMTQYLAGYEVAAKAAPDSAEQAHSRTITLTSRKAVDILSTNQIMMEESQL